MKLIGSLNKDNKEVWALTTLNNELFVGYGEAGRKVAVIVYEMKDDNKFPQHYCLTVPHLGSVNDMTPCQQHQVYIPTDNIICIVYVDTPLLIMTGYYWYICCSVST